MKPRSNPFLTRLTLVGTSFALGTSAQADVFDINDITAGFGVTDGSTYDWLDATGFWADTTTVNDGTAATVAWQGTSGVSEQAYFIGSGTAGQNYTVRLGAAGDTDVFIQNIALNVLANGSGAAPGTAGNVTIGNIGDTGNLMVRANNSVGAQNGGTLTINNGVNLNPSGTAATMNFRGGNVVINGVVSGTGGSNISSGSGAFGLTSGTLTLAGNNSFAGNVSVASGYALNLQHANALGATGGTNTVASGGALKITGATIVSGESVTINGGGGDFFGALSTGTGNVSAEWQGAVTIGATTGTRVGTVAGNLTISGNIGQSLAGSELMIRNNLAASTVFLTGSNSYTGSTQIASGIASVATIGNSGVNGPLGQNGTIRLGLTNVSGGNLTYTGTGETTTKVIDLFGTTGSVILDHSGTNLLKFSSNFTATGAGAKILTLQGSTTGTGEIAGAIVDNTATFRTSITKTGSGTWVMSGPNTYSGTTTLTTGTTQIGIASVGSVGAITSSAIGTGGLTFNGGTLSSNSTTARTILNAVTFSGNATMGDATNNGKLTFSAGMDLGAAARTITVNSEVQLDGSFTNSAATNGLVKAGAGTLTINAANTSFGDSNGFNITGGTVVAANTAAMGNAGQIVTLSSGSGFGTLDLATDSTANAYVLNFGSVAGAGGTVLVNRATSGAGITHTMGTATFGNAKVNVTAGANVTSGTPTLEFGGIVLSAGVTGDGATTLIPTSANILVSGNISRTGGSANSLVLDGTSTSNLISGIISGSQALTKSNTSTWELSNANTFTGNTRVTGGTLKLTNNLALQTSAFDTSGAGTLDFSTINTPTFGGLIGDATTGQDLVLPSNVTSLTLNVGAGVTQTYLKNISGGTAGLTLTKTGTSTQILGGTNSYTGLTTVSGGELNIQSTGAIGGTDVTVASGAQLGLEGGVTISGKTITTSGSGRGSGTGSFIGGLQSVSGTNEWAGNVILGADNSRMGARADAMLVVSGVIDDGANTYNAVFRNATKATNGAGNAGTITEISGANTYGGNTQLISGVTRLAGGDDRLPTGTILQFGGSGANAKFDMNGRNQEVAGLAVTNTATDPGRDWNANELTNSSGTLSTLNVNTAADQTFGLVTFTGSANYSGIITGNIALEKTGSAKLILTAANTYTGATTINSGTLVLGAAGSIDNTSGVALGGGTFDVSAKSGYTVNNLTGSGTVIGGLTVSTVLAIGNSPGEISFGNDLTLGGTSAFNYKFTGAATTADLGFVSGDLTLTSGATLNLFQLGTYTLSDTFTLFAYDSALIGTFNGLAEGDTATDNLGGIWRINYGESTAGANYTGSTSGLNFVNITAIPEPSAAMLTGLSLLALLRRRRA